MQHFGKANLDVVSIFESHADRVASTSGRQSGEHAGPFDAASATPTAQLSKVVAEVCGVGKLYQRILEVFTDADRLRTARSRLNNAVDASARPPPPVPTWQRPRPGGGPGLALDVAVAQDSANAHVGAEARTPSVSSVDSDESEDSDSDSSDSDGTQRPAADAPQLDAQSAEARPSDRPPGPCLDTSAVPGGLEPAELMLLSRHVPQRSYRAIRLVVRYSSTQRAAGATAAGLVLLLRALRGCPALQEVSVQFRLDEEELQQQIRGGPAQGAAVHAWHSYLAELEALLVRCPWLRRVDVSSVGRRLLANGDASELMLRLVDAAHRGWCQTRTAVLMGTHARVGRRSFLLALPRDIVHKVLDLCAPRPVCELRVRDLVLPV